ncbi:MAG: hypothetical protein ACK4MF_05785 [Hyphomicrobiaceae bacterium]
MAALTTNSTEKRSATGDDSAPQAGAAPTLKHLVLVRIAADNGATRAETIRDLGLLVAHRLSPGEWRQTAEMALAALVIEGLASEKRGRYEATAPGNLAAQRFLDLRQTVKIGAWPDVRDMLLVARALGLGNESTTRMRALGTPDGLRALIVQKAFGLPRRLNTSPAKLRTELAVVALERAFGNRIKSGLGANGGFTPKSGRMLAAQLSRRPREFTSDARLIAELAAEYVDAVQPTLDTLRSAILKRFVSEMLDRSEHSAAVPPPARERRPPQAAPRRAPAPDNDTQPATPPVPSYRPDLETFTSEVQRVASAAAEGWPGNRKAFISVVWPAIRDSRAEWGLSEIEFKCMLVEAHRAGRLALTTADLKNKGNIKEIQNSAISYMNTVWHYVRVED